MDLPLDEDKPGPRYRPGARKLDRVAEGEAQRIALRLRILAEGPSEDPHTWVAVCHFFGILPLSFPGPREAKGEYIRHDRNPPAAAITWNENLPPREQSRVIVHEIAHHLVYEAAPFFIFDSPLVYYYHDGDKTFPHRIACRVERLVIG